MSPCYAEVVAYTSGVQRVTAFKWADKRPVAVSADQAVCRRSAVMKVKAFPELFVRVETQVKRIQKPSVDKAEADTADLEFIFQRK